MTIGRKPTVSQPLRDIEADYIKAYINEYTIYKTNGLLDRAAAVAEVLRGMGHEVEPKRPRKERAVASEPLERAVESDQAPKRRPKSE